MSACILCGSPTGPTGEGMDWPRLLAERDRLQAENAALVAALRETHRDLFNGLDDCLAALVGTHRQHLEPREGCRPCDAIQCAEATISEYAKGAAGDRMRAALAAHAACTEGGTP